MPTEADAQTPAGKGAQQPGMTGQVKEDILSRFGELGVFVKEGRLMFNPRLLHIGEFLKTPKTFEYTNMNKEVKEIELEKDSLCFTYCQIPIIYKLSDKENLKVVFDEDSILEYEELKLDSQSSKKVFKRTEEIDRIIVSFKK